MNDTETILFRLALKAALENSFTEPEFRETGPAKGLKQFDRIVGLGRTPAFAFEIMHNCIASEQETAAALQSVKDVIQEQLEAFNKTKTVDANPLSRLKALILRHNAKVKAGADGVLVNGLPLTEKDKVMALTRLPDFLKTESYTAIASDKTGQKRELEVEVRLFNNR